MNRRSIGTVLLLLAVLAALAFIWGNSLDSAVESSLKSGRMRKLIQPLLELLVGQGNVTDHLVRKLAHFTEFAVLGALLLLLTLVLFMTAEFKKSDKTAALLQIPYILWLCFAGYLNLVIYLLNG